MNKRFGSITSFVFKERWMNMNQIIRDFKIIWRVIKTVSFSVQTTVMVCTTK